MSVGTSSVVDYVNTTTGVAIGVIAAGGVGGLGVVGIVNDYELYNLCTESLEPLLTENSEYIVVYTYEPYAYLLTENLDQITDEIGDPIITEE
jgi:hypothetical protein